MRWLFLGLTLICGWASAPVVGAADPGDELLRLVPADSGVTLAVEDLRGHAREIVGSSLYEGIKAFPPVQVWLASNSFRKIEQASKVIETSMGLSFTAIRDDLLGDAVIFALQFGPPGRPEEARGLLLIRPREKTLVPSLLKTLNDLQTKSGELLAVEARTRGPVSYMVRTFKQAGRVSEFYAQLDDGSLAWSNSESMIQGVIDRKRNPAGGLGDDPAFRKVRQGLPDRSLVSLFVNPRLLERLVSEPSQPSSPPNDRLAAMLARYLRSISQVGLALQWREGFHLHSHEVIDTEKLDPWLRRLMTRPSLAARMLDRVPASAVALFSANLDLEALRGAASNLIPDNDIPALDNLKLVLQGILLGHDPLVDILPRLGPEMLVYLDVEPDRAHARRLPMVAVLGSTGPIGAVDLVAPIENAFRTAFAFYALDAKRRVEHLQVENRLLGDARLTLLTDGLRTLIAARVDRDRIVLGNSTEALARFAAGKSQSTLSSLRTKYVPEAETFAIVDMRRLVAEVRDLRGPIAGFLAARSGRPVASADQDLGQLLSLAELFQAATFSTISNRDATEVHRTISLIAR